MRLVALQEQFMKSQAMQERRQHTSTYKQTGGTHVYQVMKKMQHINVDYLLILVNLTLSHFTDLL